MTIQSNKWYKFEMLDRTILIARIESTEDGTVFKDKENKVIFNSDGNKYNIDNFQYKTKTEIGDYT